jgi:hypothetical protein
MSVTTGLKLSYWSPAVVAIDGKPCVVFIDPRRTKALTGDGRRFVLSVMHERIRVADPDYENVSLAVLQFRARGEAPRETKIHFDSGVRLFSFDELDRMVQATYAMWKEVWEERVETRRRAGGSGSLL